MMDHDPPLSDAGTYMVSLRYLLRLLPALGVIVGIPVATAALKSPSSADAADARLLVSKVHGRAFHVMDGGVYLSLNADAPIKVERPVEVGPKSRLDLRLRDGGALELGPAAKLVLYLPSRSTTTTLRLESGYLKLAVPSGAPAVDVSFGRWTAQVAAGEYVFEAQRDDASACAIDGTLRIADAPEALGPGHCLRLSAPSSAPIAMDPSEWDRIGRRRSLLPVVKDVATRDRTPAADEQVVAIDKMPSARGVRIAPVAPLSTAWMEKSGRRLDDQIARAQSRLADTLIASAPTQAGPPTEIAYTTTHTLSLPPAVPAEPEPPAVEPAVPAQAPEPVPSAAGGEWIVNVATHPSLESAQAQAKLLQAKDFKTSIRRETIRGRFSYRVVIEGLPTEQAAATAQNQLASEYGMKSAWVFRKR